MGELAGWARGEGRLGEEFLVLSPDGALVSSQQRVWAAGRLPSRTQVWGPPAAMPWRPEGSWGSSSREAAP